MDRRSLLIGLAALAVAATGCQPADADLRILALSGVLPPQVLADFKAVLADSAQIRIDTRKNWVELIQQLQLWHNGSSQSKRNLIRNPFRKPLTGADWVCLSDYWLAAAIQQQLISPLKAVTEVPGWSDLPGIWKSLLQRNQAGFWTQNGPIWATPYRWGHLMMAYSRPQFKRLGWYPTRWEDLLRPELRGRIALPNHPRIVLGLLLKSLGYSINDRNPSSHPEVKEFLSALKPQVRVYTSDEYLQPLIIGDIWLAVGWSTDIQPVISRYRQLQAVAPEPGTLLTADVWVKPNLQNQAANAIALRAIDKTWLSYWWQLEVLAPLSLFSQGLSPLLIQPELVSSPVDFSEDVVLIPPAEQLRNSEFIEPLPEDAISDYSELWQILRGSE